MSPRHKFICDLVSHPCAASLSIECQLPTVFASALARYDVAFPVVRPDPLGDCPSYVTHTEPPSGQPDACFEFAALRARFVKGGAFCSVPVPLWHVANFLFLARRAASPIWMRCPIFDDALRRRERTWAAFVTAWTDRRGRSRVQGTLAAAFVNAECTKHIFDHVAQSYTTQKPDRQIAQIGLLHPPQRPRRRSAVAVGQQLSKACGVRPRATAERRTDSCQIRGDVDGSRVSRTLVRRAAPKIDVPRFGATSTDLMPIPRPWLARFGAPRTGESGREITTFSPGACGRRAIGRRLSLGAQPMGRGWVGGGCGQGSKDEDREL
ncbi:uncharacterized protein C8Q71DRAFT_64623 [Rhodofomes roseus]|uniref:Uncharacterized protein n=1 Tax=Rhodofomes roseus TaxID=34475 RepID=A0ABQ8KFK3_9APHY|nr:uncharacterized protein C8Q71DRAFT_64623 [Rhodofomes roseus]KAH9836071.1 hypothetical protein C8Q71DRAFT_64623 [Rhodofomes roseus]